MQKSRPLSQHTLCGRQLPWVDRIVHLGITITNDSNTLRTDMTIRKARYVGRNVELNQEIFFAAPATKINYINNSSCFGSTLYQLFEAESEKIESSYNRSVKIMSTTCPRTRSGGQRCSSISWRRENRPPRQKKTWSCSTTCAVISFNCPTKLSY